jgi:hypothetical protein
MTFCGLTALFASVFVDVAVETPCAVSSEDGGAPIEDAWFAEGDCPDTLARVADLPPMDRAMRLEPARPR